MKEVGNRVRHGIEETDIALDDLKQRISQVIEEEGDKIRKEGDQESARIITRARKEYKQRIVQVIVEEGQRRETLGTVRIIPVPTSDYPTPAKRPTWSVLDCTKTYEVFRIRLRPWKDALMQMLSELYRWAKTLERIG